MADQSLLIETLQAVHQHTEGVLDLLMKACNKMSLSELSTECVHQSAALKDTKKLFQTLRDAAKSSAPDQVLAEMKSYAKQQAIAESQSLETRLQSTSARTEADLKEKLKNLETRVLELDSGVETSPRKANIMEMELRAFTTKALQEAQLAVCIAERRTAEALAAAAAAEEQAEKQRLQHQVEKQKFEELLQQERRDKEAQLLDFERLLHLEHSDAQRRVRLMQEQMAELQAETTRRVSECQRFTSSLQLQSERQVKRAEAQADAKTQALHEQQLRQLQELQELLESCQAEAAERVETTQLEAEIRVDLATRRGLAAAERGATAAQQHWALSQAQAR